jgi:glutaredoxin
LNISPRALLGLALLVAAVAGAQQWWVAHRRADVGSAVATLARPGDIHMISSDTCSICVVARRWFGRHGVAYSECSIERDAACRADFEARRAPGTPVLLVRGVPQLGFSPERLRVALEKAS